jgi:membrane protein DedA with SNARE-associated domain
MNWNDISGSVWEITSHFHYLGLFALLILGGIGLPFPEDATLILCGVLLAAGSIKWAPALFVVYAGILISDFVLYYVGKKYGRKVVTQKRFHKVLPKGRLLYLEEKFRKWGVWIILVGRHVAGLRAQILIVAGIMRMHVPKFLAADAFSAMFTIVVMVGIGYKGGESMAVLQKDFTRVEHVVVVLAVAGILALIFYLYFRWRRERT